MKTRFKQEPTVARKPRDAAFLPTSSDSSIVICIHCYYSTLNSHIVSYHCNA